MPKYQIQWKAEAQNITEIKPHEDYEWLFKIMCTKCHEINDQPIPFKETDQHENIKGTNNLIMKCKFCGCAGSLDIVPKSIKSLDSEKPGFQDLVIVEGRGWEPVEWIPGAPFVGTGLKGYKFEEIDLNELEWCDYDESAGESVEIMNIESKILKA